MCANLCQHACTLHCNEVCTTFACMSELACRRTVNDQCHSLRTRNIDSSYYFARLSRRCTSSLRCSTTSVLHIPICTASAGLFEHGWLVSSGQAESTFDPTNTAAILCRIDAPYYRSMDVLILHCNSKLLARSACMSGCEATQSSVDPRSLACMSSNLLSYYDFRVATLDPSAVIS